MRLRLYLDEDVIPELARVLRSRGWDAVSAHEVGAFSLTDEEQLDRASAQGRAVLTFNYGDFLRIGREWLIANRPHAGIIVSFHQYQRRELGNLARLCLALLDAVSADNLRDSVLVLDDFRRP